MKPPYGAMAGARRHPHGYFVPVPEGVEAVTGRGGAGRSADVALSAQVLGQTSAGETVLVNAPTGFSGKLAVARLPNILGRRCGW